MNKTTLVVGVVVAIIILIGILAVFLSVEKHPDTTPSGAMMSTTPISTTTTTTTTSQSTTQPSTTTPSKLQPNSLYLLNSTNGTYWYVAVLNVTLPARPATVAYGYNVSPVYEYHLYGYTELVFPLNTEVEGNVTISVALSNGETKFFQLTYAGNWTFGKI